MCELELSKESNLLCWSSKKQTSSYNFILDIM